VLFFGRLSPYKGLDVLFEAAHSVAERVPGVHFVVAGRPNPGYEPPPLPSLPNGAKIEIINRYIPSAQLGELFGAAAVVVCPYLDATQSGVVLTAYAFDRPVVGTAVGGLPEYILHDQTGLVVPPRDPRALADSLAAVLRDRELHRRLTDGVRAARARYFNWERVAAETLAAYSRASAATILRSPQGATG
jgi:glycosyltransferase involved in cell wall biosynthesis